jgi:GT2 family glycosyltransferase/glycosyltransferase involved in cell wall biosynthesis
MRIIKVKRDELFNLVKEKIYPANIIADIGCGIRPQEFIKPKYHICIEPHNQYIEYIKNNKTNENYSFINVDWEKAVKILPDNSIETIFLLDVIEHLEKEIALKLLEETKRIITKQIIVFTPLGFIEQKHEDDKDAWGLDGGKWQEHKSGWLPEDFGEGWEFYVCEDFHSHDNLGNKYDNPKGAFFAIYNSEKKNYTAKPIFTVVVPTYNQEQYLGQALDSIIKQTVPFWEAVIINDGSTDNTADVMEYYANRDSRFRIYHKENGGVATALNEGIKHAKGEWICWLSSDDLFEPNKLEIHFNAIKEHPDIKFFHSHWYLLLEETKQKIAPGLWLSIPPTEFQVTRFFWANYIHGNAIAVHKSVFDNVGLFDETLRQGQDFDMWLRISSKYKSHFINERTCVTRIHKGQTTNSFAEGGVLDSTRALFKFLNEKSFNDLFPYTDLSNTNNILKAINEIIYISTKSEAFLYRCGYTTVLAEKTMEWFTNNISNKEREKLYPFIYKIVKQYLELPFEQEIKNILKLFLNKRKFVYNKHDFVKHTTRYIKELIQKGNQEYSRSLEKYILNCQENSSGIYQHEPILLGYPKDKNYERLKPQTITEWKVEPGGMTTNTVIQRMKICCDSCKNSFDINFEYEMITEPSAYKFICPECKKGYEFSDENFASDFVLFNKIHVGFRDAINSNSKTIAFFVRDASIIGGGTKVLFKYIEWLTELGLPVLIYSFSKKPDWVKNNIKYIQIDSEQKIRKNHTVYIVFSVFDVPLIMNRIPISQVVHLCQGYEGYHYGRNYEEVLKDKHILTKLHEIPVKNITVSTHLVNLFNDKFARNTYYIPNGIDHRIFAFSKNNREKSILFVGNPFHLLKGFDFLGSAVKKIQNSHEKINNLKLYIVMGYQPENYESLESNLSTELNCEVVVKFKLTSNEVAELMKKVSVVICTSFYEGFSLPLLESMACGTPIITTYNQGAQSFCQHGFNSLNVHYGEVDKLSMYILSILNSAINKDILIQNAYQTSLKYSEYNSAQYFVKTFEDLMGEVFDNVKKEAFFNKYKYRLDEYYEEVQDKYTEKNTKLSIVIPIYNQFIYTKKCIESIKENIKEIYELVLVDNASNDETKKQFSKTNDNIKYFRNEINYGFPIAVNQGITKSIGDYILILNNDTVLTKESIERLIEIAESDPEIGIVAPISNEVSGLQKDENAKYNSIEEMHKYAAEVREKNKGQILHFPRVAFLCTLIKREVIEKIGGLDERFTPGNFEDDDFCLRAQLAGYKTVIAKDVFIHHYGSKSFKADGAEAYRKRLEINRKKFVEKWGADPDEIWLKNKTIKPRQIYYPVDDDLFKQYFERTKVHLTDKELELAEESIINAIENYKEGDAEIIEYDDLMNLAGNVFLANGKLTEARQYFEKELNLNPQSSSACFGLGQVFLAQDNPEAAKVMLEWAVKNDPNNGAAADALADVNKLLGYELNHSSLEAS